MKIGFIGTGTMGNPMAYHILKAGHSLFICAPTGKGERTWKQRGPVLDMPPKTSAPWVIS